MKLMPAEVRERLNYDPETGLLTWRVTLTHRRSVAGAEAGNVDNKGYRCVGLNYRTYRGHHLAWAHAYGQWPAGDLDHINGNRLDNRIVNLREATRSINNQNRIGRGVYPNGGTTWRAQLVINRKQIHLGTFPTEEEARAAYLDAKRKGHPGFVESRLELKR